MTKEEKIAAFDPSGACANNSLFGLPFNAEESNVILIPVPWEASVSFRRGTSCAPESIRQASQQVDLCDAFLPDGWKNGYFLLAEDGALAEKSAEAQKLIENRRSSEAKQKLDSTAAADLLCTDMIEQVRHKAKSWLDRGKIVAVLGGDHSTPLGLLQALSELHATIGVLQIDAHMDLRENFEGLRYSHAGIMRNALAIQQIQKIVQVGVRDFCQDEWTFAQSHAERVQCFFDRQMQREKLEGRKWSSICEEVIGFLPQKVYVSLDIDGLDASLCPSTGTPVPGGMKWEETLVLLEEIVRSGRQIIGFDLCEVGASSGDSWDAVVGAQLLYRLCNLSMASRP